MGAEDILYAAWHRGLRDRVLEKLSAYNNSNEETHIKMEKAYKEVLDETLTNGEIEFKEWESSMLNSTLYNFKEELLTVEFKNGIEYSYQNVSQQEYQEFVNSESKGKHFISEIRDKKEYKRL